MDLAINYIYFSISQLFYSIIVDKILHFFYYINIQKIYKSTKEKYLQKIKKLSDSSGSFLIYKTKYLQNLLYNAKAINLQNYTCDDIFEKKLLFFLPYYIMRYKDELPFIYENTNKINALLAEYEDICKKLEKELYDYNKSILYTGLIKLINTIADYIIRSDELKKELGNVMGGQILELESERFMRVGHEEGLAEGLEKGIEKGIEKGN